MYVTVEDMRRYLNLPFHEDDYLLGQLIESAEQVIAAHLNLDSLERYEDSNGDIPAALQTAIKSLASNFYQNREPVAYGEPHPIPYTLLYILQPFKIYEKNIEE